MEHLAEHLSEDDIFTQYSGLVLYHAKRLAFAFGWEVNDAYSDGSLGLLQAIRSYDPARGASFKTFATYRIRGAIFDGIRSARPELFTAVPLERAERFLCTVEDAAAVERSTDVRRALLDLPERWRVAIELYYFGDCPREAVASLLDISPARVSQILASACYRLRVGLRAYAPVTARRRCACGPDGPCKLHGSSAAAAAA